MIARLIDSLKNGWHLQRIGKTSLIREYGFKIIAILFALAVAFIMIEASGQSALMVGNRFLQTLLKSRYSREQLFILATPIILTGLAMLVGTRMMIFNMGAEGQFLMGAWAAAAIGLNINGPTLLVLPLMFLAGAAGGALWALIPAIMRIKIGISEMLTTLLLNTAAVYWINMFTMELWRDMSTSSITLLATKNIPYRLPILTGNLYIGILIAVLIVAILAFILSKTKWGYELTSIGANRRAAEFAGMPVVKHLMTVMLLSGAIAGIAGVIELTSTVDRLSGAISQGYGYIGVNVAILAGSSALALLPFGLFMAMVLNAGIVLQAQGLSVHIVLALTGVILFFASIGEVTSSYRFVRNTPSQTNEKTDSGKGSSSPQKKRKVLKNDFGPEKAQEKSVRVTLE
jgi:ABC-type uncharacterized transport system permease subunit